MRLSGYRWTVTVGTPPTSSKETLPNGLVERMKQRRWNGGAFALARARNSGDPGIRLGSHSSSMASRGTWTAWHSYLTG